MLYLEALSNLVEAEKLVDLTSRDMKDALIRVEASNDELLHAESSLDMVRALIKHERNDKMYKASVVAYTFALALKEKAYEELMRFRPNSFR